MSSLYDKTDLIIRQHTESFLLRKTTEFYVCVQHDVIATQENTEQTIDRFTWMQGKFDNLSDAMLFIVNTY